MRKQPDNKSQVCFWVPTEIMDNVKKVCHMRRISMNQLVVNLFEEYVEGHVEDINQYDVISQRLEEN